MQVANATTVLGNFAGPSRAPGKAREPLAFSRRDDTFYVAASGAGDSESLEIRYTFGVYPLQQYLVAAQGGRYQVVDLAWDARDAADGGQRWFSPASGAFSGADSPATQSTNSRDANWNGMCAACHSTGLRKGYDVAHDRFETTWAELNVACEACHGRGSRHVEWAQRGGRGAVAHSDDKGFECRLRGASSVSWQLDPGQSIASAGGAHGASIADTAAEVNRCLPCHARRQELTREPKLTGPVLDDYAPSLLDPGLYHADGQIDDEDFEWGSFAQSRMFLAGVTCSNCHDPHTAKLKAQGNALCSQCHAPARFEQPAHHHHLTDSKGAQCVSCHMPSQTYMGVHVRRDHAIRSPRPDLTVMLGVPNACTQCHAKEGATWAARAMTSWGVKGAERETVFARAIDAGRRGTADANLQLARAAARTDLAPIRRATALSLVRGSLPAEAQAALQRSSHDADDLVRLGAARALDALVESDRVAIGVPLLADRARAVRVEAARALADTPPEALTAQQREQLTAALREWVAARLSTAERPEAHVDLAQVYLRLGRAPDAERALEHALELDSKSLAARVNLADLRRMTGRDAEAEALLRETVQLQPTAAVAWHALGLTLVRRGQRAEAMNALQRAHELAPAEADYTYAFAVALHEAGRGSEAQAVLKRALAVQPDSAVLAALLRSVEKSAKPAR